MHRCYYKSKMYEYVQQFYKMHYDLHYYREKWTNSLFDSVSLGVMRLNFIIIGK